MSKKDLDPLRVALGRMAYAARADIRTADPARLTRARRDFCAVKLERDIRETLEEYPPLTFEQNQRLASLFRSGK